MRSAVVAAIAVGVLAAAGLGPSRAGGADSNALLAGDVPVLKLYPADRQPTAIEPVLAGPDLAGLGSGAGVEGLSSGVWRVVRTSPSPSSLANSSKQLRLDTRGCSPATSAPTCYPVRRTPPTVYGRVWTGAGSFAGTTVLQYWLFYT